MCAAIPASVSVTGFTGSVAFSRKGGCIIHAMAGHAPTRIIAAAIVAVLASSGLFAQSERINIRPAPRPDQTVQMTMNQSMDMDLTIEGGAALPPGGGPMKMAMRMTMEMTQKTGSARPDGSYDSELTFGQNQVTIEMNGAPLPAAAPPSQMEGKSVTVTYDGKGQITDVKVPGGDVAADAVRQMLRSFAANLPVSTIGLGETVTTPLEFTMPLPIPGGTGMKMSGVTKMKLVSVGTDSGARVARFESTSDGQISAAPPGAGGGSMTVEMTIGGDGTQVIDLDKGVLRSSESRTRFSGKMSNSGTGAPTLPGISMQGTMTVTIASN
jgi:hypothetical protein